MRIASIVAAVAVLAALAVPVAAQQKSHLQQVLERGTLRVGTTGDFMPMSTRDPATNSFKGFDIDAATQLAKDLGVRLELVPTDWPTLIAGVTANRYDIFMGGSSLNVARAKTAGFTVPYIEASTVPVVRKSDVAKFKDWGDINKSGVAVAVVLGTVFEEQAKALTPNATIKSVQPPATGYAEVLANRADVAITSNIDAAMLVQRHKDLATWPGATGKFRRPFAYVVAQDDIVWINFLNNWIALKKSEGFFQALEKKWLEAPPQ
jgi:cyclohexadienyl dehydratase